VCVCKCVLRDGRAEEIYHVRVPQLGQKASLPDNLHMHTQLECEVGGGSYG